MISFNFVKTIGSMSEDASSIYLRRAPRKKCFSFRCCVTDQWNNLPDLVVNDTSINIFKNQADKLWEQEGIMYGPDVAIHSFGREQEGIMYGPDVAIHSWASSHRIRMQSS